VRRFEGSRFGTALVVAGLAAAILPGAAPAQVPGLPPIPGLPPANPSPERDPPPRGDRPPSQGPGNGEVVSYFGNPQNTAAFADSSVFGPLELLWTARLGGAASQPLIVPGRIIVNVPNANESGSRVVALEPSTGKELWSQPTPGTYFSAHIALDGDRVVSLNWDGVLRAFAVADGRPLWTRDLGRPDSPYQHPIARGGMVFVIASGTAHGVSSSDGTVRWTRSVKLESSTAYAALDDRRLFLSDGCGTAVALWQADGEIAWSRERSGGQCAHGTPAGIVHDGRLFTGSPGGWVYDAATGADRGSVTGGPFNAIAGDLGIAGRAAPSAIELSTSRVRWAFKENDAGPTYPHVLDPIAVGETVYATTRDGYLVGLDRTTGELRSGTRLKEGPHYSYGGPLPGMSVGQGLLLLPSGTWLHAYAPVLRPDARGIDMGATSFDVPYGKRVGLVGGLGSELRSGGPRDVVLEADAYPYGRFGRLQRGRTYADGTAYFTTRPPRNIRYRVRIPGGAASKPLHVYGYPRSNVKFSAAGRNRVRMRLSLRADRGFRVGGRQIVIYLLKAKGRRHPRLATGRLVQTGRGRARVTVTFRVPRKVSEKDATIWCFKGIRAYGRPDDPFNRRCGARIVRG
jgi:outer membrane protein assembly factor BamB